MKEIYVCKQIFGWKGIAKEEAEEKIKDGRVFGAEIVVDRGYDELKITLLKDNFGFRVSDEMIKNLVNEYFTYVDEIAGMKLEIT